MIWRRIQRQRQRQPENLPCVSLLAQQQDLDRNETCRHRIRHAQQQQSDLAAAHRGHAFTALELQFSSS